LTFETAYLLLKRANIAGVIIDTIYVILKYHSYHLIRVSNG